jgi:hypothetical protein
MLWATQQLEPGPGWAEKELSPLGVIRKENLNARFKHYKELIYEAVKKSNKGREKSARMARSGG